MPNHLNILPGRKYTKYFIDTMFRMQMNTHTRQIYIKNIQSSYGESESVGEVPLMWR